jgi:hypothetical protein
MLHEVQTDPQQMSPQWGPCMTSHTDTQQKYIFFMRTYNVSVMFNDTDYVIQQLNVTAHDTAPFK